MSQDTQNHTNDLREVVKKRYAQGCLGILYRNALVIIIVLLVGGTLFSLARAAIYKSALMKGGSI